MKKPSPPIPASVRKVEAFVDQGGSVPSQPLEKSTADKDVSGYMLRMPTPLLKELTELRDRRKAEQKAKGGRVKELLSVHSLILEAVEDLLKKEKRKATKK
jgi:hypothetical protein